jgi:hypothetical protein
VLWTILQNAVNCLFLVLCVVVLTIVLKQNASDVAANNVVEQIDLVREENRRVIGNNTTYLEGRVNELAKSQNDYQVSTSRKISLLEDKVGKLSAEGGRRRLINNNSNSLTINGTEVAVKRSSETERDVQ